MSLTLVQAVYDDRGTGEMWFLNNEVTRSTGPEARLVIHGSFFSALSSLRRFSGDDKAIWAAMVGKRCLRVFRVATVRAKKKLGASTCFRNGLCDRGFACTCRTVNPKDTLAPAPSLYPRFDLLQDSLARPRKTSRSWVAFLRIVSGIHRHTVRDRWPGKACCHQ